MTDTTPTYNAFRSVVLERAWSRSSKNYRYLCNEYYQIPYLLRECISHYYQFGSTLPTRYWSDASKVYRFGLNTHEKNNEILSYDEAHKKANEFFWEEFSGTLTVKR